MVEIFEGYDVRVEFDAPCDMQIDGEVYTDVTSYTVKCPKPENVAENAAAAEEINV